ncbi:SDR family oxidoreductase [Methanobacterium sp. CWC-01]|uniref:UDP-glucuronic acid decarboxylase family protein n=1 Tax=Methanobacterium aridiramus TaxID=2584467 RepID=UPI00257765ED|nr:UDP-glucuronic acid decarboxylase family protein [Methanobacterium sp. CWC-01]WJI08704.1 SDR family oxidoreductase [Methanobacterium sp. CWC-01]
MKKVLITGAAGFIGSHLCDRFIKEGWYVIGVDNFLSGNPENLEHLSSNQNFEFIERDIITGLNYAGHLDLILHFACPASPVDYLNFPIETLMVDSVGTSHVLNLAKEKKSRYIFASTSEVYGDPQIHPQPESYRGNVNPVGPRSVYDEAKRFSEALSMAYYREYGLDVRIVRIFNTYGPRMKLEDGRVVPNFIFQALKGMDLTVYGDGSQTRSFCYVDDLVEGIVLVAEQEEIDYRVLNLGNPDEYKIIDFAQIIIEKTGSNSKIIFKPLPRDDPKMRKPDITKAVECLQWKPEISLDEGIRRTIEFFQSEIEDHEIEDQD